MKMADMRANIMAKLVIFLMLSFSANVQGYNSWTEYWEAYESTSYFPRLYPYQQDFHDTAVGSGDGFDAEIHFSIPYFGRYYKSAYVSKDGFVRLSKAVPAQPTPHHPNTPLPNPDYPEEEDPPLIAPFYSSWELRATDQGNIFWRRLDPDEETDEGQRDIAEGMLEVLSQEVRRHVVGGDRFHARKGLIVTWDMMEFYGCLPISTCPTNTIQMALVADEFGSFVVYNYYNTSWSGGVADFCDPSTGVVGDPPFDVCFQAQVGFNEGEGRNFLALPHSNTPDVVDLDIKGATGVQGRYIYDVTYPTVVRGGCTNDTENDQYSWTLEVFPQSVGLFAGSPVYFSGPCLLPSQNLRCRFGRHEVYGAAVPDTQSKGMCVTPTLETAGWTDFCVSLNAGTDYNFCTQIYITPKYYHWTKVHLHNDNWEWYKLEHGDLSLTWNPHDLLYLHESYCEEDMEMCNNTNPEDMTVDIHLVGYKEDINVNGTLQGHWMDVHTFTTDIPNSGEFTFNTADHVCTVDCGWEKPLIGVIRIVVHDEPELYVRAISSEPVPLGWYHMAALSDQLGGDWSEKLCNDWAIAETNDWKDELWPCPMTKSQAYTDMGRFIYPDPDCEPGHPCPMRTRPEPHIECVESVLPTFSKHGSSSTCCYSSEGHLLYGLDTKQGSTLNRASPYASKDSYDVKVTPWLSHWSRDRLPYILCCLWSSDGVCLENYMKHRNPNTAEAYQPVKYGAGYGDPHFISFDGSEYMFNGHGEFWLLQIDNMEERYDNFMIQVRSQQPPEQHGYPVNGSVMTALVMQEGWGVDMEVYRIQLEVNDMDSTSAISVYVSGTLREFNSPELMYQEVYSLNGRRTIIQNNDPLNANHQSNFTLVFQNDIAVQVANRDGFLHLLVVLPQKYYRMTSGLLGVWNDDPSDDLRTPMGEVIPADDPPDRIHRDFGQAWEVVQGTGDSLFLYRGKADWEYFRNPDFEPNFVEPEDTPHNITDEEVTEVCGENFICRFDYKTTMSKNVANSSLHMQVWINEARMFTVEELSCPFVDIEHSVRDVDKYTVGGHLRLTGCSEGYTLQGDTDYHCVETSETEANWQPSPNAECRSDADLEKEQQMLVTAIVVPIVLVLILVAVGLGGFVYYRKKKGPQDSAGKLPKKNQNRSQQSTEMAQSASMSQSLASINTSFGSIVLSEDVQPARPRRPQSMQTAPPHPVAGHAQLSHGGVPYTPTTNTNTPLPGQGYSLSPGGPLNQHQPQNQSREMNNSRLNQSADHRSNQSLDRYNSQQPGQVNKSFDQQSGQMNRSYENRPYNSNGQLNGSFDPQAGQMNMSFDPSGQVNRSFDANGRVNRSFDQGPGAYRAASQTSLSRGPPTGQPARGTSNPALSTEDSDSSDNPDLNSSKNREVYTMNGFGQDTVV